MDFFEGLVNALKFVVPFWVVVCLFLLLAIVLIWGPK